MYLPFASSGMPFKLWVLEGVATLQKKQQDSGQPSRLKWTGLPPALTAARRPARGEGDKTANPPKCLIAFFLIFFFFQNVESYEDKVISNALTAKGTNQTACVCFLYLCYLDLAYSQPENPTKTPWIDRQIPHQYSTIYNSPRYSFHLVPG